MMICGRLKFEPPTRFTAADDGRNIAPLNTQGRLVLALLMSSPGVWRPVAEIAQAATWRGEIGDPVPAQIKNIMWQVAVAISGLADVEWRRGLGYRVVAQAGPRALRHQSLKTPVCGTWWRLRQCRQHYAPELTVTAFARQIGMCPETLMRHERGLHQPSARTVRSFAEALGCSADELLGLAPIGGRPGPLDQLQILGGECVAALHPKRSGPSPHRRATRVDVFRTEAVASYTPRGGPDQAFCAAADHVRALVRNGAQAAGPYLLRAACGALEIVECGLPALPKPASPVRS